MTVPEYGAYLLTRLDKAIADGMKPEIAIETMLSSNQYDWLCDHDFDLDKYVLGEDGAKNAKEFSTKNRTRRLSPEGYNKKYPIEKQNLYHDLVGFLKEHGADIVEREKQNFRDIDFSVNGTVYKIVFSAPTKKK